LIRWCLWDRRLLMKVVGNALCVFVHRFTSLSGQGQELKLQKRCLSYNGRQSKFDTEICT
jgi:hypothetical protein